MISTPSLEAIAEALSSKDYMSPSERAELADAIRSHAQKQSEDTKRYFEMIGNYTGKVMGVTPMDGLLSALQEENGHMVVGEITKEQFESYGDNSWEEPIAAKHFYARLVESVELEPAALRSESKEVNPLYKSDPESFRSDDNNEGP